jgi:hypothetical protein
VRVSGLFPDQLGETRGTGAAQHGQQRDYPGISRKYPAGRGTDTLLNGIWVISRGPLADSAGTSAEDICQQSGDNDRKAWRRFRDKGLAAGGDKS